MSEKKMVDIVDLEGNALSVGVPIWNPRIANVTLLAIGSSAPEILLGFFSTFGTGGVAHSDGAKKHNPSALGPMIMIGSASFNLLVTTGVSILAVEKTKKIEFFKSFLVTFLFSCFAYLWMFLVLYIISPAQVELWEAVLTLLFYPIMVGAVWLTERKNDPVKVCDYPGCKFEDHSGHSLHQDKRMIRMMLRNKAESLGALHVIDMATGQHRHGSEQFR